MAPVTIKVPSPQTSIVALSSGKRMKNIATGRKLSTVIKKAQKAAPSEEPTVFFVPKKKMTHVL